MVFIVLVVTYSVSLHFSFRPSSKSFDLRVRMLFNALNGMHEHGRMRQLKLHLNAIIEKTNTPTHPKVHLTWAEQSGFRLNNGRHKSKCHNLMGAVDMLTNQPISPVIVSYKSSLQCWTKPFDKHTTDTDANRTWMTSIPHWRSSGSGKSITFPFTQIEIGCNRAYSISRQFTHNFPSLKLTNWAMIRRKHLHADTDKHTISIWQQWI